MVGQGFFEVKQKLISDSYEKALKEKGLRPVIYPEIEEIQFGRGQELKFAATIETQPDFEMPQYKGMPLKRVMRSVTEEDIDRFFKLVKSCAG